MAFEVKRLENEPIVILTVTNPLGEIVEETLAADNGVAEASKTVETKYIRVADITDLEMTFSQIAEWLGEQRQAHPGSINDPRIALNVIAGATELGKNVAEWSKQEQYGSVEFAVFETLDEALAHAREQVKAGKHLQQAE